MSESNPYQTPASPTEHGPSLPPLKVLHVFIVPLATLAVQSATIVLIFNVPILGILLATLAIPAFFGGCIHHSIFLVRILERRDPAALAGGWSASRRLITQLAICLLDFLLGAMALWAGSYMVPEIP